MLGEFGGLQQELKPTGVISLALHTDSPTRKRTPLTHGRSTPYLSCLPFPTIGGRGDLGREYKYIPVRRLALCIQESVYHSTEWAVFEPNGEPLRAQIRLGIRGTQCGPKERLLCTSLFPCYGHDLHWYQHDFNAAILGPPFLVLIRGNGLVFAVAYGGQKPGVNAYGLL